MVPTGGNRFPEENDSFVRKKRLHYKLVPSAMLLSDQLSETDPSAAGMLAVGGEDVRTLPSLSHGSVSVCGRRREMEDAVTVAPEFLSGELRKYDFFAVYDGHGGSRVAQACRDRLHRIVAKEIEGYEESKIDLMINEVDWEKIMVTSFSKMDDEVNGIGVQEVEGRSDSMKTIGSTAVVAIVGRDEFVIANCGDSRGILCRGGIAVPLSHDHKPERPDEMERVEAAGGRVINWNGYRVLGVLATSRSIGDHYLKPFVISKPDVTVNKRTNADEFLIIGSDGLWDMVSNDVACEVVKKCLRMAKRFSKTTTRSVAGEAAAVLVELAMARGSKDNISVVVVELKDNNQKQCCGNGSSAS